MQEDIHESSGMSANGVFVLEVQNVPPTKSDLEVVALAKNITGKFMPQPTESFDTLTAWAAK
jgi:hypothetical protein